MDHGEGPRYRLDLARVVELKAENAGLCGNPGDPAAGLPGVVRKCALMASEQPAQPGAKRRRGSLLRCHQYIARGPRGLRLGCRPPRNRDLSCEAGPCRNKLSTQGLVLL